MVTGLAVRLVGDPIKPLVFGRVTGVEDVLDLDVDLSDDRPGRFELIVCREILGGLLGRGVIGRRLGCPAHREQQTKDCRERQGLEATGRGP